MRNDSKYRNYVKPNNEDVCDDEWVSIYYKGAVRNENAFCESIFELKNTVKKHFLEKNGKHFGIRSFISFDKIRIF